MSLYVQYFDILNRFGFASRLWWTERDRTAFSNSAY